MTSNSPINRPIDQIDFDAIRADAKSDSQHPTPENKQPARHGLSDVIAEGFQRGLAFWAGLGRFV